MAWCAVVGCNNKKKSGQNSDKTFFLLPKEEPMKKEWIKCINRSP